MNFKTNIIFVFIFLSGAVLCADAPAQEEVSFSDYCLNSFLKDGVCPAQVCEMKCSAQQAVNPDCAKGCLPKACPKIKADDCPLDYCAVMTDCSDKKICHYQMVGEKPACGDLAYAGQDVACCKGLQRRCGVEFFEGHCDMEGKNSVYNIPICIPCGDGVCGQFEDRCNCPEDCQHNPPEPADIKTLKSKLKEKPDEQTPESAVEKEVPAKIIEIVPAPKKKRSR